MPGILSECRSLCLAAKIKWLQRTGDGSGSSHDNEQRERGGWRDDGMEDGGVEGWSERGEAQREIEREEPQSERERERERERE